MTGIARQVCMTGARWDSGGLMAGTQGTLNEYFQRNEEFKKEDRSN